MRNSLRKKGPLAGVLLLGMVMGGCGIRPPAPPPPPEPEGDAARGGALYDKYWNVAGVAAEEPTETHSLWATRPDMVTNTRTGADTWRCKECHGWDYKGVDGAYAGGSHRTGFAGILGTTLDEDGVFDLIKTDHGYGAAGLTDEDVDDLVAFVLEGLIDTDDIIDMDGVFTGSAAAGVAPYTTACFACHGADGLRPPPGSPDHDEFVGLIANENPWEFQHKVRFGQPGTGMSPQFGILDMDALGDLGAHSQTLPTEAAAVSGDAARGGALYDKFWNVSGVTAAEPTETHDLWMTRPDLVSNIRTGADTWRCKECHGWDYKGVDGAYASGSHKTGFAGIFGTAMSATDAFDLIKTDHGYGAAGLTDADIDDLVAFVLEGQIDTDTIIDANGAFTGLAADGVATYTSACFACHGADGLQAPPGSPDHDEFVGLIANDNPWEFQHKVRFGQPGSIMPAQFGGLDIDGLADLGAHSQTLPES